MILSLAGIGCVCMFAAVGSTHWSEADGGFPHIGLFEYCTDTACFEANGGGIDDDVWDAWRAVQGLTLLAIMLGCAALAAAVPVVFARQVKWKNYVVGGWMIAALFGMIAISVWKTRVVDEAFAQFEMGYSFYLMTFGWGVLFLAALFFVGLDQDTGGDAKLILNFVLGIAALVCFVVATASTKWAKNDAASLGLVEECTTTCSEIEYDNFLGVDVSDDFEARYRAAGGANSIAGILTAIACVMEFFMVFRKKPLRIPILILRFIAAVFGVLAIAMYKLGWMNMHDALRWNLGYSFYMAGVGTALSFLLFKSLLNLNSKITNFKGLIFYFTSSIGFVLTCISLSGVDWLVRDGGLGVASSARYGLFQWCVTAECENNNDEIQDLLDSSLDEQNEMGAGWRTTQAFVALTFVVSVVNYVLTNLFLFRGFGSKIVLIILNIAACVLAVVALSTFRGAVYDSDLIVGLDLGDTYTVGGVAAGVYAASALALFFLNVGNGLFGPTNSPTTQNQRGNGNFQPMASSNEMAKPQFTREPSAPENKPPPNNRIPSPAQLPPGWVCYNDERTGVPYYWHEGSGEARWEPPVA